MNPLNPEPRSRPEPDLEDRSFSRRRLFELGGAGLGVAALLAACSKEAAPAAGRVGEAPDPTDLPPVEVNDAVYLRTMESVERSILEVYAVLAGIEGLGDGTTTALARYTDDHTSTAEALAGLTTDNGGESYSCANPWLMERALQPALDNIVGRSRSGDDPAIPPSDDAERDTLSMINGLETLAAATYQLMVEKLTTPDLRAAVIPFGAEAARRAAAIAVIAGGDEDRFVSPVLLGGEIAPDDEGFTAAYAVPTRFGQLTPVEITIGTKNDLGLRYTATFETPADNAYRYAEDSCPA